MAIDINLNTSGAAQLSPTIQDTGTNAAAASGKKLAPLLGGNSLTVSDVLTTDFSTLVERLKGEQERTKFALLFASLQSLNMSMTAAEKASVKLGLQLSEELEKFKEQLKDLQDKLDGAKNDVVALNTQIEVLENQIKLAQQEGKDHNELVKKEKALREELDAKKLIIEETPSKINEVRNKISEVNGKISVVASSIGENALKTIANEIAGVFGPEEGETNAEEQKHLAKEEEVDPFKPIRESLDKFRTELLDTIAANTSEIKA